MQLICEAYQLMRKPGLGATKRCTTSSRSGTKASSIATDEITRDILAIKIRQREQPWT